MLDFGPIANVVKSMQGPLPQAQPSVVEETKPVPESETQHAVPPLPQKGGGEAGLGEHLDLYDTETPQNPAQAKPKPEVEHEDARDATNEKNGKQEKPEPKPLKLAGSESGLPQPTTNLPEFELPFLKPLGQLIGQSVDAVG
ncbi:MAG: hypothetical protein M3Y08_02215 [Fibrobacterota bacterium]|nr:hypothetical protein [Fibrobacterota bacterium]